MIIRFVKESSDITNDEINYIQSATSSLLNTKVTLADKHFSVKHTLLLTMIDAKVCNAATHNIHNEMLHLWRNIQRL